MSRTGRSYVATAFALGIFGLSGCAAEQSDVGVGSQNEAPENEDWGDPVKYPEIGGKFHSLTAFNGTCTFQNGTMTITAAAGNQEMVIGKRAVDSAIVVNGAVQTSALPTSCATATSSTVKVLKIIATTGDQVVVLDFLGGLFAPGIATARGIVIDLGAQTNGDEVRIRGTAGADNWVFGSDGLAVNTDAFRDVDFIGIEKLNFSLGTGNDVLTGTVVPAGAGSGKGVAASANVPVIVFGGDGNDSLTGGEKNDKLMGGPGNDTLVGGGTGAAGEKDWLIGEAGADIIQQGAANNGPDVIVCGTEAVVDPDAPVRDTVTYSGRGNLDARNVASSMTLMATDSERVKITLDQTLVDLVNNTTGVATPDTVRDVDAEGYPIYPAANGAVTEAFGSLGTLVAAENDMISPDCEIVVGGMDNDELTGDGSNNILQGGAGDDTLVGGAGDDVLSGDDGNDFFDDTGASDTGADTFNGGNGTADLVSYALRSVGVEVTMDGADANDGVPGEEDNVKVDVENVVGSSFADKITGNEKANVITGGLGADELDGGEGNDTFDEGVVNSNGDKITGGEGVDTVDYSKRGKSVWVTMAGEVANDGEVTYTGTVPNLPTRTVNSQATIVGLESVASSGTSAELDNVMEDVENVNGTLVNDDITGNELANSLDGGPGSDFLFGLAGSDVLYGGGDGVGSETIVLADLNADADSTDLNVAVADTNDYLYGGIGADQLDGGGGASSTANKLVCGDGEDIGTYAGSVTFVPASGVGAYRDVSCES